MAITRVQSNHFQASGGAGSISVGLTGVAAGAAIVGGASHDDVGGTATVSSVTDDLAAAGAISHQFDDVSGFAQNFAHFAWKNHGGGNRSFTATFNVSAAFRNIAVVELAGAEQTGTLAGPATHGSGTSAAPSSGNVTPANDGAYFFGQAQGQSVTPTAAAPFGSVLDETAALQNFEDYIQPAKLARNAVWTMASAFWTALVSTYYAAVVAPPGTCQAPMAAQQRRG